MDAIRTYIRFGSVMSEPIEGRIKDARVYLSLLRAMVEQKKDPSKGKIRFWRLRKKKEWY